MKSFTSRNQMKAFMKKESERLCISVQNVYNTFFARKILEKIAMKNDERLIVKGSAAETIYLGELVRSIVDLDLASLEGFNFYVDFVINILLDMGDDGFQFVPRANPRRTKTGIIKLPSLAIFDGVEQPVNIDFQDNYNRLIEREKREIPVIFEGDEPMEIYLPSFEEYLAEKLCIIVESNKTNVLNTRVKDFYDIYQLHGGKYDHEKLSKYFAKMLALRNKISLSDASTLHLNTDFVEQHNDLWDRIKLKYDFLDDKVSLIEAVYYTRGAIRSMLQELGIPMPENSNLRHKQKFISMALVKRD